MIENNKTTFYSAYSLEFEEYLDSFLVGLKEKNSEYSNILFEIEELKKSYPNVRKVVDDRENITLTNKEMDILLKIMDLQDHSKNYEYKEMFFRGVEEGKRIILML